MIRRIDFTAPLGFSLAGIVLGLAFVVVALPGIISAVFARGIDDIDLTSQASRIELAHKASMDTNMRRIDGRSLFFAPLPPPQPPKQVVAAPPLPPTEPVVEDEPVDTPPPPPATAPPTYTGPAPRAIAIDTVWFPDEREKGLGEVDGPLSIRVGETKNGIEVVEILGPNSIKLRHRGGEYAVAIFADAMSTTELLEQGAKETSLPPGLIVASKADRAAAEKNRIAPPPVDTSETTTPVETPATPPARPVIAPRTDYGPEGSPPAASPRRSGGRGFATDGRGNRIENATEIPAGATEIEAADGRRLRVNRTSNANARVEEGEREKREAARELDEESEARDTDEDAEERPKSPAGPPS
jgi:hypothetical protein